MPCYHPLTVYRRQGYVFPDSKDPTRSRSITFDTRFRHVPGFEEFQVPCGQCIGCRLQRSKDWALRIALEKQNHLESCFITLTYDDDHLPEDGSLRPDDVTLFLKRLRKYLSEEFGKRIRYFYCGEYGEKFERPHYHLCLFGHEFFEDRKFYKRTFAGDMFTSKKLQDLWQNGYCPFGSLTFDSAAYTARYILKKITGEPSEEHYQGRYPEFVRMSRRPGIGQSWFKNFGDDIYLSDRDFITIKRGVKARPPRYFDRLFEEHHKNYFRFTVQPRRKELGKLLSADNTPQRLEVKEMVTRAKVNQLKRRYECGLK